MEEDHCGNLPVKPFCSYKGCNVEIDVPSGGRYCRRHRQKVYKKNYLKRSKKFRAKYQVGDHWGLFDVQNTQLSLRCNPFEDVVEWCCVAKLPLGVTHGR